MSRYQKHIDLSCQRCKEVIASTMNTINRTCLRDPDSCAFISEYNAKFPTEVCSFARNYFRILNSIKQSDERLGNNHAQNEILNPINPPTGELKDCLNRFVLGECCSSPEVNTPNNLNRNQKQYFWEARADGKENTTQPPSNRSNDEDGPKWEVYIGDCTITLPGCINDFRNDNKQSLSYPSLPSEADLYSSPSNCLGVVAVNTENKCSNGSFYTKYIIRNRRTLQTYHVAGPCCGTSISTNNMGPPERRRSNLETIPNIREEATLGGDTRNSGSGLIGKCPLPEPGNMPGSGTPGTHNPAVKKCLNGGHRRLAPWHTLEPCPGTDDNGNMKSDTICYGDCVQDCYDNNIVSTLRRNRCIDKCKCQRAQRAYACYQQGGHPDPNNPGEFIPNPLGHKNPYCDCLAKYCKPLRSDPDAPGNMGDPCYKHMFPIDCGCGQRRPECGNCPPVTSR